MVKIQLISPQKGYLDVKEGTNFPVNISASDIRNIGSRSSTFSKTVVLTGSENNNQLLNYYFDVNIQAGTFDVNKVQKCVVIEDDVIILDNCILSLQSVNNFRDEIEYTCLVSSDVADLFAKMGDKLLTDIDFSDLNHVYNSANIIATWNNTFTGYKYLLPYSQYNEYPISELKPAIYVSEYFKRIFESNGFTYTINNIAIKRFDRLLIPYNGDDLKLTEANLDSVRCIETKTQHRVSKSINILGQFDTASLDITGYTEVQDSSNLFNPTTGVYVSSVNTLPFSGTINFKLQTTLVATVNNTGANPTYVYGTTSTSNADLTYRADVVVYIKKSGTTSFVFHQAFPIYSNQILSPASSRVSYPVGATDVYTVPVNATIGVKDVEGGDELILQVRQQTFGNYRFYDQVTEANSLSVAFRTDFNDIQLVVEPNGVGLPSGSTLDMNQCVPVNIKQSDFVKAVLKMHNAFMIQDDVNTNQISITTRDAYYDSGAVVDWSFKLDKSKEVSVQFIPELTSKEITFTYKADKDVVNEGYQNATREVYGVQLFKFDNQYIKGRDVQELLFSPTPHGVTTFGAYLPYINGYAPKNNIRILLDSGQKTCGLITVLDYGTTGNTSTVYNPFTHFFNPEQPTYDINFGVCDFYFYDLNYFTPNNLFNTYYLRLLNQMNKGRMMTAYFQLNALDIRKLKLNDKIKIGNSLWNINKVIDYNANSNVTTKVELISVDDGTRILPATKPPTGVGGTATPGGTGGGGTTTPPGGTFNPTKNGTPTRSKLEREYSQELIAYENLIFGQDVNVQGRGNYIVGNNVTVVGDNNNIVGNSVSLNGQDENVFNDYNTLPTAPDNALLDENGNFLLDEFQQYITGL